MSSTLSYERRPPIGNSLIDDEPGVVQIRIFPDRTLGRAVSFVLIALAVAFFALTLTRMRWTRIGMLQSVPPLAAAGLMLGCGLTLRYTSAAGFTTIHATAARIEFTAGGFDGRRIERSQIARIFTRDMPLSKRWSLGLRLRSGAEMVLGVGTKQEIEAMARALHGVLNEGCVGS